MEKKSFKKNYLKRTIIAFLTILLLSSTLSVFAGAVTTTSEDYGNLLQYEWRETGADSENTRASAGPAPSTPTILWSVPTSTIPASGIVYAWDGKIFTFSGSTIYALDPFTGNKLWNITMPSGWSAQAGTGGTSQAFRIDDSYGGIWTSRGPVFFNYKSGTLAGLTYFNTTETGRTALNGDWAESISLGGGSVFYYAGFYNAEAKVFVRYARMMDTNEHGAVAFDCSNPTLPAPLKWVFRADVGVEVLGSYGNIVYLGGYGEGEVYAVNANTGKQIWMQWKVGNAGYSGTGYEGMFIHGASSVFLTGYNATTGKIVWDYNAGERAYFVYGGATMYGRWYSTNIAVDPSGYFGCWDVYTGKLLWKTPALWNIAYLVPVVADGKVYCQRYSGTAGGIAAEQNGFMCMDAFTGEIIWEIPGISLSHPSIAYGNFYGVWGGRLYCLSDQALDNSFPAWHGIPADNGVAVGQTAPSDIRVPKWTFATYGPITGSPVAANGKIYFGSFDQNLYCLDATTGALIWNYTVGYRIRSTPFIDGSVVYLGPDDGYIYAFNANTGQRLWKTPAPGTWTISVPGEVVWTPAWSPRSCPIVTGGSLFVASMDGKIYCVDTTNGAVRWSRALGNATYPIGGTPAVANNVVYIAGGSNGTLSALNVADGSIKWQIVLDTTQRRCVGTPIIVGDALYIGTSYPNHRIEMLNATTGVRITFAQLNLSTGSTPAVFTPTFRANTVIEIANQTNLGNTTLPYIINTTSSQYTSQTRDVVFAVEGMHISAWIVLYNGTNIGSSTGAGRYVINATTMVRVWRQWIGHQIFSSLTVAEDLSGMKVYGGSDVNSVTVLNATSGKPLSSYSTGAMVFGVVAVYNGRIYAGSHDKMLYCFEDPKKTAPMTVYANINKGAEMWNNETILIAGRLQPTVTAIYPFRDMGNFADNGLPNTEVLVSFTSPSGVSTNVTATTDNLGYFTLTYSPTELGEWGWVALYDGEEKPWITYEQAYSTYGTLKVVAAPNTEPAPTTTPTETPVATPTETPAVTPEVTATPTPEIVNNVDDTMTYVYVAIAAIALVAVAAVAYMYMQRGKKSKA